MDLYRANILDHYKHPRNFGHLEGADVRQTEENPSCGDKIVMEVKYNNKIIDIRFSGVGCAINQASASMLTEKVKGMNREEVMQLQLKDIELMLGTSLTPSRIKCALLPLEALQKTVWIIPIQK